MISVIIGSFFAILYIIGLIFCCGYGGKLLGGYHYQPKTKRGMKYHKRLMLRVGLGFLFISACIHIAIMFAVYKKIIWFVVFLIVSIVAAILGIIYINTSKKIKMFMERERDDYIENSDSSGEQKENI